MTGRIRGAFGDGRFAKPERKCTSLTGIVTPRRSPRILRQQLRLRGIVYKLPGSAHTAMYASIASLPAHDPRLTVTALCTHGAYLGGRWLSASAPAILHKPRIHSGDIGVYHYLSGLQ